MSEIPETTDLNRKLVGQMANEFYGSQGAAIYSPEGVAYRKVVLQRLSPSDDQST